MGIEPFLVSSSTNLILAQRLARKICSECKEKIDISDKALVDLGVEPAVARKTACYKGKGCATCGGTGYKGRIALYEVMPFSEGLKELVLNGASTAEIKKHAIAEGMNSLRMSGITKVGEGVTTIEEILRVTMAD
jgi:type IV pilus assembly protein PilB